MLAQVPTPDSKIELNITSFFTLSHPLHCPICAKDGMVTELLLQLMEDEKIGYGFFMLGFGWGGTGGGCHIFPICCSVFVLLLIVLSGWYMVIFVSVSLFFFCFVCLLSL